MPPHMVMGMNVIELRHPGNGQIWVWVHPQSHVHIASTPAGLSLGNPLGHLLMTPFLMAVTPPPALTSLF